MRGIKFTIFIFIFLSITSCAKLTRHFDPVEMDDFLNKFPLVNNEILGELKYDDPDLDLRTLGIDNYQDLFAQLEDLTEDHKKVVRFFQNNTSKQKFVMFKDTFIICLQADHYDLTLCDEASTEAPTPDKVSTENPTPSIEDLYNDLAKNLKLD